MRKFNETIKIEVEVDVIANKLLSMFKEDEKHSELVVETIIGHAINGKSDALSPLFNALNGYTDDVDFKVGEVVTCEDNYYDGEDGEGHSKYTNYGDVKIINIVPFRKDKLQVEYTKSNGKTQTTWVRHTSCSKIPVENGICEDGLFKA